MPPKRSTTRDLVSPEGLRQDGRRPGEMREVKAQLGILPHADGSALYEVGNTRLIASVHGPLESSSSSSSSGSSVGGDLQSSSSHGTIRVTFHQAAFSSLGDQRRRLGSANRPHMGGGGGGQHQSAAPRTDRKLEEWSRFLEDTLGSVVMTSTFPRSCIKIFIEVVSADGGTYVTGKQKHSHTYHIGILAASICATTLALIDCGIPMIDYLLAGSLVHSGREALFDTNRQEEAMASSSSASGVITVAVLPRSRTVAFVSMEPPRMPADRLEGLLGSAVAGCQRIWERLDGQIVRPHLIGQIK